MYKNIQVAHTSHERSNSIAGMERALEITADGSTTIHVRGLNATYHSRYGAIQESMHVFIRPGLLQMLNAGATIRIFEMGFGTGLNALLTLQAAMLNNQRIEYETVETYPLHPSEYSRLNYGDHLHPATLQQYLLLLHEGSWGKTEAVQPLMTLLKREESLLNYVSTKPFHLIYFDAFAPALQPELWTQQVFEKMHAMLESNGLLLTYCSKGGRKKSNAVGRF